MALNDYQKRDIAMQLNLSLNSDLENNKDLEIARYSESTQTYYADDSLAKQHVKQITKEDIKQTETIRNLDECMNELQLKLGIKDKKNRWRSTLK